MSSWGNNNVTSNAVLWAAQLLKVGSGNANIAGNNTSLFQNTTISAFISGQEIGLYGINPTEMNNANGGGVVQALVWISGSGYGANATATIPQGNTAAANASANATGRATINITNFGNLYNTNTGGPTVTVAAPSAQTFSANAAVAVNGQIAITSTIFQNNDFVQYLVATGNTVLAGLVNAASYFVVGANSSGLYLSNTVNGAVITLTKGLTETGHSLTGQAATGTLTINTSGGFPWGNLSLTQSFFGSGYSANAVVTVNSSLCTGYKAVGATANAHANSSFHIDAVNITANGTGYQASHSELLVTIAAPAAKTFNANTGVVNNSLAVTGFNNGDQATYLVAAGNTALLGLSNGTLYTIGFANSTTVSLVLVPGTNAISITPSIVSETGHSLTGVTATAKLVIGGTPEKMSGIAHAGWNLVKIGTGGRRGRIMSECLVAMGSIGADSTNNALFPSS